MGASTKLLRYFTSPNTDVRLKPSDEMRTEKSLGMSWRSDPGSEPTSKASGFYFTHKPTHAYQYGQ